MKRTKRSIEYVMPDDPRIDWPALCREVIEHVPRPELAELIGVSESAVRGWLRGVEPRFVVGCMLIEIWVARTGKRGAEIPTVPIAARESVVLPIEVPDA